MRMVVPVSSERRSTLSQTCLTIHRPKPDVASGPGAREPASGSLMKPASVTWQTISSVSYQIESMPAVRACCTVLAATSLTAMTRSMARLWLRPASSVHRLTRARTAARSVVNESVTTSASEGSGTPAFTAAQDAPECLPAGYQARYACYAATPAYAGGNSVPARIG
jgi:hypothetical protein